MIENNKLNGLSGWLTLFTVCWLYTLTIIPIATYETYQKIDMKLYQKYIDHEIAIKNNELVLAHDSDGVPQLLTQEKQDKILAEMMGVVFGVILTIDLLESTLKYFRRKTKAPSSIVWSLAGIGIYFSAGYLTNYGISTGGNYFRSLGGLFMLNIPGDSSAAVAAYADIVFSLGWIIYFKSSSRVKNTFTTP